MCEYAAVGREWGLVSKFGHVFLDFRGRKHYLVELREREWNHSPNPKHIDGMRCYYEAANKMMLLKRLKRIGVSDPEARVQIIHEIKGVVERRFGNAVRDSEELEV